MECAARLTDYDIYNALFQYAREQKDPYDILPWLVELCLNSNYRFFTL